jgi:hypothetical protein
VLSVEDNQAVIDVISEISGRAKRCKNFLMLVIRKGACLYRSARNSEGGHSAECC